jgi:CHAT domain-containing protein
MFRTIPLAALYNGTQHLCEKYSSSITPSVQIIRSETYTSLKDADVLKMGATKFMTSLPIPQTLGEMEIISQLEMVSASPPTQNLIYLNQQFNELNVRKLIQNGNEQIVHFATHGKAVKDPGQSYIVSGVNDLPITASDFRSMKGLDKKELVVFSACETFINSPKEQFGLAGAAMIGGAKSVIGSYWIVSENYTLAFMSGFYQQLLNAGLPKVKAIQNIQIAMLSGRVSIDKVAGTLSIAPSSIPSTLGGVTLQLPTYVARNLTVSVIKPEAFMHPYAWASLALAGNPW